jgi:uncharacterized protein (TIGR02611 family)
MLGSVQESWRQFKGSKPGQRCQDRYHRLQRTGRSRFRRILNVVVGLAIAIGGLVLGWAPGLGTLSFFLGMGMIAGEFRPLACLLDWAEVRGRKLASWVKDIWRLSAAGKTLVVSAAALCVAAVLYVTYLLLFGD